MWSGLSLRENKVLSDTSWAAASVDGSDRLNSDVANGDSIGDPRRHRDEERG